MLKKIIANIIRTVAVVAGLILALCGALIAEDYRYEAREAWTRQEGDALRARGSIVLLGSVGLTLVMAIGLFAVADKIDEQ
jgi:hypothetical protein